jgi:hypothetical protein
MLVLHRQNKHGLDGVEVGVRKDALEDGAHAFELMSGTARFLFRSVADNAKVWRADLKPRVRLGVGRERKQDEECELPEHRDVYRYTAAGRRTRGEGVAAVNEY